MCTIPNRLRSRNVIRVSPKSLSHHAFEKPAGSGLADAQWMWLAGCETPQSHTRTVIRLASGGACEFDFILLQEGKLLVFVSDCEPLPRVKEGARLGAAFAHRTEAHGNPHRAILAGVYSVRR
jgi:hypothetical protein